MWQIFHEHLPIMVCREDAHLALISGYNNVTSQHTYIGGYETCAVLISKNCAQLQVLQMKICQMVKSVQPTGVLIPVV
jgi:hypothetical protein